MGKVSKWWRRMFSREADIYDEVDRRSKEVQEADLARVIALNAYKQEATRLLKQAQAAREAKGLWLESAHRLAIAKKDLALLKRSSSEPPPPTRSLRLVKDANTETPGDVVPRS